MWTGGVVVCLALLVLGTATEEASSSVCPEGTFSRANSKGEHVHCICPDSSICEGCEEGCKIDASPYKERCIRGFQPSCTTCRCKPGPKAGDKFIGALVDRRKDAFCEGAVSEAQKYKGNKTFVFVISNGHTGTTYLGQASHWRENFGKKLDSRFYIAHEQDADKGLLKSVPWDADFCAKGVEYVLERKLPQMERVLDHLSREVWFGSGHQIILGLLPALVDVFGDRAKFVRMRRNRLDTAFSYAAKKGGPCTHRCVYCLCPLDPATRCPPRGDVWSKLSVYQQYLWFVDEVECQWQALLRSRPKMQYMELDWDKHMLPEQLRQVADFIGMPVQDAPAEQAANNKANVHHKPSTRNETAIEEEDKGYRELIGLKRCDTFKCVPDL